MMSYFNGKAQRLKKAIGLWTSERDEPAIMAVIKSLRSRLNVRVCHTEAIYNTHTPEVSCTFLHVPERVLRNADSVTQSFDLIGPLHTCAWVAGQNNKLRLVNSVVTAENP